MQRITVSLSNLTEEPSRSSIDIELKKNVVYGISRQGQPFVTMTNYVRVLGIIV